MMLCESCATDVAIAPLVIPYPLIDELLVAHAKYLPQFKEKIEELKAKGVHSTDPVVMDLMEHGH